MHRVVLISAVAAGLVLALSACGGSTTSNTAHETPTTSKATSTTHAGMTTVNSKTLTTQHKPTSPKTTQPKPTSPTTTQHKATSPVSTVGRATETETSTAAAGTPTLPVTDCRKLTTLAGKMGQAFTGRTPAADTKAYADFLEQLAKTAPTEVRADFGVLADAYAKIAAAVAAVYGKPGVTPTSDQLNQLADVGKELNGGELKHAAENVNAWLQQGCAH